jgi:hypothetical protein
MEMRKGNQMRQREVKRTWKGLTMVLGAVLGTGLVLAACSSGSPSATDPTTTTRPPVTTSTTSPRVTTTTVPEPTPTPRSTTTTTTAAVDSVTMAIDAFQAANGPAKGWVITSTQTSADPSYVLFKLGPAPGYETSYQGGYGFVQHQASGAWLVIGFGTFGVGCPSDGSTAPAVPAQVLSGFGLSCSS